jgi:hypothetical protein
MLKKNFILSVVAFGLLAPLPLYAGPGTITATKQPLPALGMVPSDLLRVKCSCQNRHNGSWICEHKLCK